MRSFIFVIGFFFLASPAFAATYYVSPGGNDSNAGTQSAPYKTYNKAQNVAASGDTIHMLAGTYPSMTVSKNGLTLIGHNAVIDAAKTSNLMSTSQSDFDTNAILITGNNITMDGFEAMHSWDHVVHIVGKHIVFKNSYVHDGIYKQRGADGYPTYGNWGSGVALKHDPHGPNGSARQAEDVTIDNIRIERVYGEGLDMYGVSNVTVTHSTIVDAFSQGYYIDNSNNIRIENNFAYCADKRFFRNGQPMVAFGMAIERIERWYPSIQWGSQMHTIRIVNNISYGCNGINMWGSEQPSGTANNGLMHAVIAHNSIFATAKGSAISISSQPDNTDIVIRNNLTTGSIDQSGNVTLAGNVSDITFSSEQFSNPLYLQPPNGKDKGVSADVLVDFSGAPRDSKPDAGAWEIGASGSVSPSIAPTPSADANNDGRVDGIDYSVWLTHYNRAVTGVINGDFNNDGKVDGVDYVVWLNFYR